MGTPHGGLRAYVPAVSAEVPEMISGSPLLTALTKSAWNPQGVGGTDWLTMGSDDDDAVAADRAVGASRDRRSAKYIGSAHKVWYTSVDKLEHDSYYRSDSIQPTAVAYQSFGHSAFTFANGTLWPVRRTYYSLIYGDM